MDESAKAYEEALYRWFKANKDHPGIYHGPIPDPGNYFAVMDSTTVWYAGRIEQRVRREMERSS